MDFPYENKWIGTGQIQLHMERHVWVLQPFVRLWQTSLEPYRWTEANLRGVWGRNLQENLYGAVNFKQKFRESQLVSTEVFSMQSWCDWKTKKVLLIC